MIKKLAYYSFYILFFSTAIYAQGEPEPINIGEKYSIESKILGQERPVLIYLPNDYDKNEGAYPVMYLLDGWANFHHTTASVNFLAKHKRMPEMIVVGIPNTDDRTRDLTPALQTGGDNFPTAGGADNLIKFMEEELIPWVNENYRTENYKMLVGHSFGGLFAAHTLVNHPTIFNSYIAISPSLWWDKQNLVLEQTDDFLENQKELKGHFYMTMGNEGGAMLGGAWKLAAALKEKGPQNLYWEFNHMPEETHGTIPSRSTYKGLEFIFEKWNKESWQEAFKSGGIDEIEHFEETTQKLYGHTPKWEEPNLIRLGRSFYEEGNTTKALPIFKKSTELFPESEQAWFYYGQSLAKTGEKKQAIKNLKHALSMAPDNLRIAIALKRLGERVSQVPNIKLSKKALENYVGKYDFEIGIKVTIISDTKQLWGESDEVMSEKEALVALGKHRFFIYSENTTVTFELADDTVTGIVADTPNGSFTGKRKTDD